MVYVQFAVNDIIIFERYYLFEKIVLEMKGFHHFQHLRHQKVLCILAFRQVKNIFLCNFRIQSNFPENGKNAFDIPRVKKMKAKI